MNEGRPGGRSPRRIGILLERQGVIMGHKKLYRIYRAERLAVKR